MGRRRVAGALSRKWVQDGVLATAVFAVDLVVCWSRNPEPPNTPWPFVVLYAAAGATLLLVRRRWPGRVLVLALGHSLLATVVVPDYLPILPLWVALFSIAAYAPRRRAVAGLAATFIQGCVGVAQDMARNDPASRSDVLVMAGVAMVVAHLTIFGAGRWAHWSIEARRIIADRAAAEAAAHERRRVARDLHDVVAHAITLMLLQAGAAAQLVRTEPERAEEALLRIDSIGQQGIVELGRMLGILEVPPDSDPATSRPAGLADLERLVEVAAGCSAGVELVVTGQPAPLDRGVDLAAYRIVQEALTNATRYAARGAPIQVRLTWLPAALDIEVNNRIDPAAPRRTRSGGRGLVTMRERAEACGGGFHASGLPDDTFVVSVWLPTAAALVGGER
jgi:signal transduction histidine kinase